MSADTASVPPMQAGPVLDAPPTKRAPAYWLFSGPVDLGVFLGSAVLSLAALALGACLGILHQDTPDWAWVPCVLLIDIAHVWSTAFRVYLDPDELHRRPLLYFLVPVVGFAAGVALYYYQGPLIFWRSLAYLAVFHFVRQQYGWVALYRAKLGERGRLGRWLDTATIYLATVYPLVYWHANLPLRFNWFVPGDFAQVPAECATLLWPVYLAVLAVYGCRLAYQWLVTRQSNPGKDIVVVTTAVCWYVGIVGFNSDYAFTVTNVIIHGVPYFALVFWYWQRRRPAAERRQGGTLPALLLFMATVWLLAYLEEMLWYRGVWHQKRWLFGDYWQIGSWERVLVPLLALPQLTHYVLDGFIWRRRSNPRFALIPKRVSDAS